MTRMVRCNRAVAGEECYLLHAIIEGCGGPLAKHVTSLSFGGRITDPSRFRGTTICFAILKLFACRPCARGPRRNPNSCRDDCETTNDGVSTKGRVCDALCHDGNPYGMWGCNASGGDYGAFCRTCFYDVEKALDEDTNDERTIMSELVPLCFGVKRWLGVAAFPVPSTHTGVETHSEHSLTAKVIFLTICGSPPLAT